MAQSEARFPSLTRRALLESGTALALGSALSAGATSSRAEDASSGADADPSNAVWQSFLAALAPLARHVGGERAGDDAVTRAEGIRCLSRLLALGLDRFVEFADPRRPAFYDLQTPTRKYLGDNPDQTYRTAPLDGRGRYRITGTLAGSVGIEVGVYAGEFRSDAKATSPRRRLVAACDERTLEASADGHFTLTLGPEKLSGNHLPIDADASSILIRTYFHDRRLREQQPMPRIERLDPQPPPAPLDLETLTRGLLAAAAFVDGSRDFWNRFEGTRTRANRLIEMPDDGTIQTPSRVRYLNGRIELPPDQALLLEMKPKKEPGYWSWVLQNIWGETFDWQQHRIVLNNREVVRNDDGRIRIAVAHRRPVDPRIDWLDLAGHRRALLSLRWRGESALPRVDTRVVPIASLA